jgi:NAD-dependent dihydropyrimidine dehydrogenase PreA subunit
MIKIEDKKNCCGCTACSQVCHRHCIAMKRDEEGFDYPIVDEELCVNCGLCEKVCPVINQNNTPRPILHVYAQKHKDEEVRINSSSGGVFSLIAEKIISERGVVFGATFDENWDVKHDYTETIDGISLFRTSKYVQSKIGKSYQKAEEFLKQGRQVMFVGTSCQIDGLKLFLRKDYDSLLCIDVICHGVPSPKIWRDYLEKIKTKEAFQCNKFFCTSQTNQSVITNVNFRDKVSGWRTFSLSVSFSRVLDENTKKTYSQSKILTKDVYMRAFLNNLSLRPSCYHCPSKNGSCKSDITLADFWGIRRKYYEFDDNKGVGLTIVHTSKGLAALDMNKVDNIEVTIDEAIKSNPAYIISAREPLRRKEFFNRFNSGEDLNTIVADILHQPILKRIKIKLKESIKLFIISVFGIGNIKQIKSLFINNY